MHSRNLFEYNLVRLKVFSTVHDIWHSGGYIINVHVEQSSSSHTYSSERVLFSNHMNFNICLPMWAMWKKTWKMRKIWGKYHVNGCLSCTSHSDVGEQPDRREVTDFVMHCNLRGLYIEHQSHYHDAKINFRWYGNSESLATNPDSCFKTILVVLVVTILVHNIILWSFTTST